MKKTTNTNGVGRAEDLSKRVPIKRASFSLPVGNTLWKPIHLQVNIGEHSPRA